MDEPRIRALRGALERRPPWLFVDDGAMLRAAVSLLVRPRPADLEILLIERPSRETDPWSGHVALPGGKRHADEDLLATAIRETLEEVGVDLPRSGALIGRLDDVVPARGGPRIAVSPFVFAVTPEVDVIPDSGEVAAALWVPLRHLGDPAAATEHLYPVPGHEPLRFPAIALHPHVIWGLTYRMVAQLIEIARSAADPEEN